MSLISATQGVRDEIAVRLNEVESDNTDQYTNWINLSLRDIENTNPFSPHLRTSTDRTLSSGTRLYAVPSDFSKMNSVLHLSSNQYLKHVVPVEFDRLHASAMGSSNVLTEFTIRGQGGNAQIEYYPTPGGSLLIHLEYQRAIVTVSASSAVIDVPSQYLELPVLYGETQGMKRRNLMERVAIVEGQYEKLKQKMVADLQQNIAPQITP